MFLRVPMQTTHGPFETTSAGILVRLPTGDQTLVLSGDVLVSVNTDGKRSTFRRAPK